MCQSDQAVQTLGCHSGRDLPIDRIGDTPDLGS